MERLLGAGGMGEVYLVRDLALKRQVALKTLRVDQLSQEALKRWRSEMEIMATLSHPNVVNIYHAVLAEGEGEPTYVVMEYLPRGSLQDELDALSTRRVAMPIAQALMIGIQISEALSFIHQKGIIHRDIKPHNILIGEIGGKPIYKLGDFGIALARDRTRVTQTGGFGPLSPIFASPEQILGYPPDQRSDIYSLGVTLWECLARPAGRLEAVRFSASQPLPPLSSFRVDILPALQEAIARATASHPDQRFQSAAEFAAALRQVQQQYELLSYRTMQQSVIPPPIAPFPPPLAAPPRRSRTSPALIIVILLLAVCLLSLLTALWSAVSSVLERESAAQQSAGSLPSISALSTAATSPVASSKRDSTAQPNTELTPMVPVVRVYPEATSTAVAAATAQARRAMAQADLWRILRATDTQLWILGDLGYRRRLFHFNGEDLLLIPVSLEELSDVKRGTMDSTGTIWILTPKDVHRLVGNEWVRAVDVQATLGSRRYELDHIGHLYDDTIFIIGRWSEQGDWLINRPFVLFGKDQQWEIELFDLRDAYVEYVVSATELWLVESNGVVSYFVKGQRKQTVQCGSATIRRFASLPGSSSDGYAVDSYPQDIWRVKQGKCERVIFSADLTRDFSPWTIRVPSPDTVWFFSREGELLSYQRDKWQRQRLFQSHTLNHVYVVSDRSAWLVGDKGLIMHYQDGVWSVRFGE
ncbi:MAG: serine/threonine-protein kinase [Anaerolineae bacterium]|nr:serine/threonine protein kinase [Thermoflexales bacterium]MDW8395715.1 serine/threonine-protein kinase [Anaerolineae bacterium]